MISVEEIIEDNDLAQDFIIYRTSGSFIGGRWVSGTPVRISARGTISVAREKDLRQVPEADRVAGAMVFHNRGVMYPTRTSPTNAISDKIFWRGEWYKVISVFPYVDYGYYKAIAERTVGD